MMRDSRRAGDASAALPVGFRILKVPSVAARAVERLSVFYRKERMGPTAGRYFPFSSVFFRVGTGKRTFAGLVA